MAYNPRDFFFKKAKKERFAARSVFKLEEMDQKLRLIREGNAVLDLGCAPGSWSQYASRKTGPKGRVVGIDLTKVRLALPNALFLQGDAFSDIELPVAEFDVVLSDMAPKTTGIRLTDQARSYELCLRALETARARLKPGGNFVAKIFQSGDFPRFVAMVRESFRKVEIERPRSVRKESFEIYVVGMGLIKR